MPATEYRELAAGFKPDILVGLGDVPFGYYKVSHKKIDKITDRTAKWMSEHVKDRAVQGKEQGELGLLFAPLLPLSIDAQRYYVDCLVDDMLESIHGLAVYSTVTLSNLPTQLQDLSRLGLTEPKTPRALLHDIANGIDILTLPFLGAITDEGIALNFTFPPSTPAPSTPESLGIDMWDKAHATDTSPLVQNCTCYACINHHRAFLHHLLSAKEMLAWVLLQIHNYHTLDTFFAAIRNSIANETFEQDMVSFERHYEPEFPEHKGRGPRYVNMFPLSYALYSGRAKADSC